MRIVEDGSPEPDVRLIIDSKDCEWIEPWFLHVDRQIDGDSPNFRTLGIRPESRTCTLYNDAEEGDLWLVDDIKSQTKMLEDSTNESILVMVAGCCIGGPFGIVGLVLALIGTGEEKKPPVQVNIQTPMMTTDDIYKSLHREQYLENEEELVPGPFTDVEEGARFGGLSRIRGSRGKEPMTIKGRMADLRLSLKSLAS